VLELGAGVGRVSMRLGALGVQVWALEKEQELLDEIARLGRAGGIGKITPICTDARSSISLGRSFDLVLAPQVFVQMFERRAERTAIMKTVARHLAPRDDSSFWMTFHPDLEQAWAEEEAPLAHQVRELDGRTFEIRPVDAYWFSDNGERSLRIVWSRGANGEEGTTERSYAALTQATVEHEAGQAGLELVESVSLRGNHNFLDQVALRFIAHGR
jgi:hypothetical protein